jgi:excisionase family DNA binding protein
MKGGLIMSQYLSAAEVAERFGITETTVREWLRDGKLVGVKIGSTWRVKETDLDRYLESQRVKVLIERAKRKDPEGNWQETNCVQCGEVIVVKGAKESRIWVCSPECKKEYDKAVRHIVGDEGALSTVAPRI